MGRIRAEHKFGDKLMIEWIGTDGDAVIVSYLFCALASSMSTTLTVGWR